jgi:hypothetical protein
MVYIIINQITINSKCIIYKILTIFKMSIHNNHKNKKRQIIIYKYNLKFLQRDKFKFQEINIGKVAHLMKLKL